MFFRNLARLAAVLMVSCAPVLFTTVQAADSSWRLMENPYFRVLSNADEKPARELVGELDKFRVVLQQLSNLTLPADAPPVTVLVFGTRDEFRSFRPAGRSGRTVGGYVVFGVADLPGPTVVLSVQDAGEADLQTIRHEYVHVLNRYRPVRFPKWYEEGIAEVFSLVRIEGQKVTVGLPPRDRFETIQAYLGVGMDAWASFDDLVSGKYDPQQTRFAGAYAQFWLLAHYLTYGRPDLSAELDRCLVLSDGMMQPLDAFRNAFGMTPDEMWSRELQDYVGRIPGQVYNFRKPIEPTSFSTGPADAAEVRAILGALKAAMQ